MPFIARPAAGQIIDPAWGTLVADAVVMRFTTAAQRSSQLTAPVSGQLTALDSRPGVVQFWSGSAWVDAAPFIQSGFAQPTTDGGGNAFIPYPTAFSANPTVTFGSLVTGAGTVPVTFALVSDASGTTGCTVRAARGSTLVTGVIVAIYWIAIGLRPAPT